MTLALLLAAGVSWAADVDRLLATEFEAGAPGASVVVARHGEVLFRKSYGLASVEPRVALTTDMPMPIASVTKQFTAAAVLLLAERGALRLDDPAQRFVPELPPSVKVEHLLTHTSGVRSFTEIPAWYEKVRVDPTKAVPPADVLALVVREPLLFEPGSAEGYSNSNYFLLGEIVTRASGRDFETFLAESVLRPLGMTKTACGSAGKVDPVVGYRHASEGWVPQPWFGGPGCTGGGGLVTTVDDLARWGAALAGDGLLSAKSREAMRRPYRLADGSEASWGYGMEAWDYGGHSFRTHGGYVWGFPSAVILEPQDGTFVAVLSNNAWDEIDVPYVARQVAAIAVGRPVAEPQAITLPGWSAERYTGVYRTPAGGRWKVRLADGQLFTQRDGGSSWPIHAESAGRFFYERSFARVVFMTDEKGLVTHAVVSGEGRPETMTRLGDLPRKAAVALAPELLQEYVGEYEIRAGSVVSVTREGTRLFAQPTGGPREEVFAEAEGRFFMTTSDQVFTFVRDEGGRVSKVVLSEDDWSLECRRVR